MSSGPVDWAKRTTTGSPSKKIILLVLAEFADEEWSCFPGQAKIARITELGERQVRRLLAEMEADGLLRREARMRSEGRGRTSDRYYLNPDQPVIDDDDQPDIEDGPTGHPATTNRTPMSGEELPGRTPRGRTPSPEQAHGQLALVAHEAPALPAVYADRPLTTLGFDAFYRAYPRHVGRRTAEQAWHKAIRRAHPGDIIAGAQRYAADPNRVDAYTKHPATWLNADSWEDDPLPARDAPAAGGRPSVVGVAQRVASGALGVFADDVWGDGGHMPAVGR